MAAATMGNATKLGMAIGIVLAGAMIGQEISPSVAANAKTKVDKKTAKRVCRAVTPTGSRLVERICRTQADWDVAEKQSQDGLMKQQQDGAVRPFENKGVPGI